MKLLVATLVVVQLIIVYKRIGEMEEAVSNCYYRLPTTAGRAPQLRVAAARGHGCKRSTAPLPEVFAPRHRRLPVTNQTL